MKEINPSPDFVKNVMTRIQLIEEKRPGFRGKSAVSVLVGYAGAMGALLIGIANLLRILVLMYAPVVCH